jgi:hypothetical protein
MGKFLGKIKMDVEVRNWGEGEGNLRRGNRGVEGWKG